MGIPFIQRECSTSSEMPCGARLRISYRSWQGFLSSSLSLVNNL
jgi:hypothetical protein